MKYYVEMLKTIQPVAVPTKRHTEGLTAFSGVGALDLAPSLKFPAEDAPGPSCMEECQSQMTLPSPRSYPPHLTGDSGTFLKISGTLDFGRVSGVSFGGITGPVR